MAAGSVVTLLFPAAAKTSVQLAIVARAGLGLLHAIGCPALTGAWGAWAPPSERSSLNGIVCAGGSLGTLVIFTLAGALADTLGWEAVFYVTGGLGLVWVAAWFPLVADTPALHPRISREERDFIQTSLGRSKVHMTSSPRPRQASPPSWTGGGWPRPGGRCWGRGRCGAWCSATPPSTGATTPSPSSSPPTSPTCSGKGDKFINSKYKILIKQTLHSAPFNRR